MSAERMVSSVNARPGPGGSKAQSGVNGSFTRWKAEARARGAVPRNRATCLGSFSCCGARVALPSLPVGTLSLRTVERLR